MLFLSFRWATSIKLATTACFLRSSHNNLGSHPSNKLQSALSKRHAGLRACGLQSGDAMTTSLPRRGPSVATTSQSRPSYLSYPSHQPSRMESRTDRRRSTVDADSNDKNTVALIRRVLCPDASAYGSTAPRPLQDLLPPLTSSNDVDLQLYALIAIIIKEFVYSWYAKITPDHIFVDEVLQLIAHCTRALEQRLRQVDVGELALDEVTGLIQAHIIAYRIAARGSDLVAVRSSTREVYHKLNPHPGLSPVPDSSSVSQCVEQQENERLYRHLLAQGVLAVLLPTEDLENVCLRTLVEDVISDLILGKEVGGRICEGWFIWTAVSKVITLTRQKDADSMLSSEEKSDTAELNRLERFGLLSDDGVEDEPHHRNTQSKTSLWLWKTLSSIYFAYVTIRFIIGGLLHTAFSNPEASTKETNPTDHLCTLKISNHATALRPVLGYRAFNLLSQLVGVSHRMPWLSGSLSLIQNLALTGPGKLGDAGSILDRYLRDLIGTYVLNPTILPVLLFTVRATLFPSNARPSGVVSAGNGAEQGPLRLNDENSHISQQQQHLPSARSTDISSSDIIREAHAPASAPASQQGDNTPSPSEVAAIKRQCAADILSLIPGPIARAFFRGVDTDDTNNTGHNNDHDERRQPSGDSSQDDDEDNDDDDDRYDHAQEELLEAIENDILDPFSDTYCNKHLIFAIIEMILVKLIPELSEHSISGLMEERGVTP